jgi:hypothetical protein
VTSAAIATPFALISFRASPTDCGLRPITTTVAPLLDKLSCGRETDPARAASDNDNLVCEAAHSPFISGDMP